MAITKVTSGLISADASSIDLNIDAGTLYLDVSENRVGIGTTSPKTTLNVAANNSGQGPILTLENTDTSLTTNDVVGQIDFYGNDGSTGGTGQKATIQAIAQNSSGTSVGLIFGTSPFPDTTATERMRIDSSGNVGIGISPSNTFSVGASGTVTTRYTSTDTSAFSLLQFENSGSIVLSADHGNSAANSNIIFKSDGAIERMRIDSSGRVIVSSAGSPFGADSVTIDQGGFLAIRNTSGSGMEVRRDSTDGSLIDFQKDGSAVGSIGTRASLLKIGTGDVGLLFNSSSDAILPENIDGGAGRDGAIDLGVAGARYKDLYLSGGAYLGGTGAANHLDDYEEGTWTPSIVSATGVAYSTQYGTYTKVGRNVTINFLLQITTAPTGGSNLRMILPFEPLGSTTFVEGGTLIVGDGLNMTADARNRVRIVSYQGSTNFYFYDMSSQDVFNYTSAFTTGIISASFTYQTE